jgi:hypothetical protein
LKFWHPRDGSNKTTRGQAREICRQTGTTNQFSPAPVFERRRGWLACGECLATPGLKTGEEQARLQVMWPVAKAIELRSENRVLNRLKTTGKTTESGIPAFKLLSRFLPSARPTLFLHPFVSVFRCHCPATFGVFDGV